LHVANLQETILWEADLRGTKLYTANLRGADLVNANLQKAYLAAADLRGAIIYGANLQNTVLTGVLYDRYTERPDGFAPPDTALNWDQLSEEQREVLPADRWYLLDR
jgi:uncharacterized protein YjbI with pentapeptide repeats